MPAALNVTVLNKVSDRLLARLAPKATVNGCTCAPDGFYRFYGCFDGFVYQQYCTYTCNCGLHCGNQFKTTAHC